MTFMAAILEVADHVFTQISRSIVSWRKERVRAIFDKKACEK